jgi:hypothetical protein
MVETIVRNTDKTKLKFDVHRWIAQMNRIGEDLNRVKVEDWVDFLYECTNLFRELGSAMSIAFSDVTEKAKTIADNYTFIQKQYGLQDPSL